MFYEHRLRDSETLLDKKGDHLLSYLEAQVWPLCQVWNLSLVKTMGPKSEDTKVGLVNCFEKF